jgi:hypothetical protein
MISYNIIKEHKSTSGLVIKNNFGQLGPWNPLKLGEKEGI